MAMNDEERSPTAEGRGTRDAPDSGFSFRNRFFGDRMTIRRKLVIILVVTSMLAVLVASSAFIVLSWFTRRQALERDLASMARAIGHNCEVALQFYIPEDAERILATVEARPAIVLACVYDADGQLLAAYDPEARATSALPLEAGPEVEPHQHPAGLLHVSHPVLLGNRQIGTVYMEADMREIWAEMGRDSLMLAGVALLALIGSYLLSSRLQGLISDPILALAATARTISEAEDYSVRADRLAGGEMATLVEAFNRMLEAIEVRDGALLVSQKRYQAMFHTAEVSLWEQDISEVQRMMRELSSQGVSDFRDYLEEHPDFVARAAGQVRVVDVNAATVKMFDAGSKDELLGSLDRVFVPESLPVFREELVAIAEGRQTFEAEAIQQTLAGRRIVVLMSMALPREGDLPQAITSIMDISERKATEEELERHRHHLEDMVAERTEELENARDALVRQERLAVLGQLAGGVSHELRNPLGVISNAVYFLRSVMPDADDRVKEYLEIIASEVRSSDRIVAGLLDLSRTRPAERGDVRVAELVATVLEKQPPPDGIEVATDIDPALQPVHVDVQQISQVLNNLVTNAYQAMPGGGTLKIKATAAEDGARISFADTGCGIPEEDMEKLFEPLFTTKARGIGLGLSVSKNLAEVNGGSIEVEGEVDQGSTFTVVLPGRDG